MTGFLITGGFVIFTAILIGLLLKRNGDLSLQNRQLVEEKKRRDADVEIIKEQRDTKPIRSHDDVDDRVSKHDKD